MSTIVIRELRDDDLHFIFSTMLRGTFFGNDYYNKIDKRVFYKHYSPIIEKIVELSRLTSRVACLADDNSVIVGYILVNGPVLHFAYVKSAWRHQGILTLMLNSLDKAIESVTHLTKPGDAIRLAKGVDFNPFQY